MIRFGSGSLAANVADEGFDSRVNALVFHKVVATLKGLAAGFALVLLLRIVLLSMAFHVHFVREADAALVADVVERSTLVGHHVVL